MATPAGSPQAAFPRGGASPPSGAAKNAPPASGEASLPTRRAQEDQAPQVSRLQMIEYMNARKWWARGQVSLLFTTGLWISFVLIVWLRTDVVASYEVNSALLGYVRQIKANPSITGIPPTPPEKMPVQCRCACKNSNKGEPAGPCGTLGNDGLYTEFYDFVGELSPANASELGVEAGGIETAPTLTLATISSIEDVWYWVEHGFVPAVWLPMSGRLGGEQDPRGLLLRRNLVLGGVRARQVRAKPGACEVSGDLSRLYPIECRTKEVAVQAYGSKDLEAFENYTAMWDAFRPVSEPAEMGYYDAMLDVERPPSEILMEVELMKRHAWLDSMAVQLELSALLLNVEVGVYALMQVTFDFPVDGGVDSKVRVRVLRAVDSAAIAWQDLIPEIIWAILIVLLLRQEVWQVCKCSWNKKLGEYLHDPWNWNLVDWLSIGFGVPVALYWYAVAFRTSEMSKGVLGLPRKPSGGELSLHWPSHREKWGLMLDSASDILTIKYYHQLCLFLYTTILTFRFLKSFLTQQRLATIQIAIGLSFFDVCHFLCIYLTILANFVLGGRILFGQELENWSSIMKAGGSTLRMLMGHAELREMYEIAPVSTTIWFWLFLICVMFVLSNLMLAIIYEHWENFRSLIGPTPTMLQDAKIGWEDFLWRFEWRVDLVKEGEYREALNNPYDSICEEIMEAAEVDDDFMEASRKSCLGIRLIRKRMEGASTEGLRSDGSAGGKTIDSLDLRKMGADPVTAEHLLEECQRFASSEVKAGSRLDQVRELSRLVERHKQLLEEHCEAIESGTEEGRGHLWQTLERFERSLQHSLESFANLRSSGVDTFAPPLLEGNRNFNPEPAPLELSYEEEFEGQNWGEEYGGQGIDADYLALRLAATGEGEGAGDWNGNGPPALDDGDFGA